MSDLISRQAAIDALHMHLMYRMGTDSNKKRLDDWINNLPSVQPEPHWIPVTERLPEGGGYYIVTENVSEDGDKWVGLRWYSTVRWWEFDPVAWMPLPEPYQ